MTGEPYYVTTAISYPNAPPHIGHAYEAIAADVVARFQRQCGRDVRFQTGTDEHGLKMAQRARDEDTSPRALADAMSLKFKQMCDVLDVQPDRFIRTTEVAHYRASQAMWTAMVASGDLYLDRYEGWYSVRDEAFYAEDEVADGEGGVRLSPQGTPVEWTVEDSWFFRLSRYQQPLLALYEANRDFIRPAGRRNEVMRFVQAGLRDLSVSRTSFDWGVPVPGSDGHVMYVWVDALTNYLTGLGYPDTNAPEWRFWPATVHLIGKDIVRFHAVYWPAFLMSAGLPLPQQVFGHGFVLSRGEKMSKSVGNVIGPIGLVEEFGSDAVRYFLMRDITFGNDGSISEEALATRCNAELSNSFGNLAQRVLSFVAKHCDGLPEHRPSAVDDALIGLVHNACAVDLPAAFDQLDFSNGIECWLKAVFACNAYVDEQAPWSLRKQDPVRMQTVLATLIIAIRLLAIAIAPVVPRGAGMILDQLGVLPEERDLAAIRDHKWYDQARTRMAELPVPVPAFKRIELA